MGKPVKQLAKFFLFGVSTRLTKPMTFQKLRAKLRTRARPKFEMAGQCQH